MVPTRSDQPRSDQPRSDQPRSDRSRPDRCPGVLRPWLADDGALVRLRLIGGRLPAAALSGLLAIAAEYGDGNLHLTGRANLQLRALPYADGAVPTELPCDLVDRFRATGLLPAPGHELVRNIMVSPLTGRLDGRADLRPVATALDRGLSSDPVFSKLAGRFLFVLDDGRGDLVDRSLDLGLVVVDESSAQLRVGSRRWGEVVALGDAPGVLLELTRRFLASRGDGPAAPWHVDELADASPLAPAAPRDDRTRVRTGPPAHGLLRQDDGLVARHVEVPDGVLTPALAASLAAPADGELLVTPWRGVVVPDLSEGTPR